MKLNIKQLMHGAIIPSYATKGAACFDFHACFFNPETSSAIVHPGTPTTFRTGLAIEVPENHVLLIFSRSGHGFKNDVRLANCVGVIDSDYRGEIMVKLTNDNQDGQSIKVAHGDRIAQGMVVPVNQVEFEATEKLSETARGEGGFGSTGK